MFVFLKSFTHLSDNNVLQNIVSDWISSNNVKPTLFTAIMIILSIMTQLLNSCHLSYPCTCMMLPFDSDSNDIHLKCMYTMQYFIYLILEVLLIYQLHAHFLNKCCLDKYIWPLNMLEGLVWCIWPFSLLQ